VNIARVLVIVAVMMPAALASQDCENFCSCAWEVDPAGCQRACIDAINRCPEELERRIIDARLSLFKQSQKYCANEADEQLDRSICDKIDRYLSEQRR
jgi:hypothetical protein